MAGVETEGPRQHIADYADDGEEGHVFCAEQLNAEDDTCQRAVYNRTEYAHKTQACCQGCGETHQRTKYTAHGCADEEGGNDFTALVARTEGHSCEQHFQEKCIPDCMSLDGVLDDMCTCTVVIVVANQNSAKDNNAATNKNTEICVFDIVSHKVTDLVEDHAEQNPCQCAGGTDDDHLCAVHQLKGNGLRNVECFGLQCKGTRDELGDVRCGQAGDKCGVVHDAYADKFNDEDGCGNGGAEDCREQGAHAAHGNELLVMFFQMEQTTDAAAAAAPQLQGCPFTASGTAKQVGNDRSCENKESHALRDFLFMGNHGGDQKIGAGVLFQPHDPIQEYDHKACERKQINQPRVVHTKCGGQCKGFIKGHTDQTARYTYKAAEEGPVDEYPQIFA